MREPRVKMNLIKDRRRKLAAELGDSALILPAHPERIRNHDVYHSYRQDSNLFYLTGFEEPESVLIFTPGKSPETTLFVRPKDESQETWFGFRYGIAATKELFQVDAVYEISEFEARAPELLCKCSSLYYKMYEDVAFDEKLSHVQKAVKKLQGRGGKACLSVIDSSFLLGEMRLRKSSFEVERMKLAALATCEGHKEIMRSTQPGVTEMALHGVFLKEIMSRGCAREAYRSIVAAGNQATTLHYEFNDQVLVEGDLMLVDAGGEYDYYAADVTRCCPVSGKFNSAQKRLYNKVLELQKALIKMVSPGVSKAAIHDASVDGLIAIMIDEKLLTGTPEEIKEQQSYRKYYPHGVGHWLGLDVHDAGLIEIENKSRLLEEGFCLTIEPGIYIPKNSESVPEELKGIGIRIEDDILVTETGYDNLTREAPKEVAEIESLMAERR